MFSLEKGNERTTSEYFRGSKRKENFLVQMITKRMQLENFRLSDIQPENISLIKKKKKKTDLFLRPDLYEIHDLSQIDSQIDFLVMLDTNILFA